MENVAALRWRNGGLDHVLAGLAEARYDAVWRCVRASDIGAAHRRERVFLCAVPQPGRQPDDAHSAGTRRRTPRPRRPRTAPRGRAPGEPQRRGRRRGAAEPVAPDTDGGGLALRGAQDGRETRATGPGRMRHTHRLRAPAADSDRLGREELHARHTSRREVPTRPGSRPDRSSAGNRKALRGNEIPGWGEAS
ncbi:MULTISPECIES: DNA cytosine methyltransferase [Amycolatopsis]|uniref:DNA cytosine methyltransferase n=1 Tax=Amycolatopsis TaxID=1813 RepID=UPI0033B1A3AC